LLLAAAALRLWDLAGLPAGFSDDEFQQIRLMQDGVQRGDIRVFYQIDNRGQEGLYHTALALSSIAFGEGTIGLRMLSVFAGMLTIALTFSLGTRLFGRLAGIFSAGVIAFAFETVFLSRLVLVEAMIPLLIATILLALARALPVYRRTRAETSHTIDFAAFGTLTGIGLYLHPTGLMLVLIVALFIVYSIYVRQLVTMRQISYTGFAILMLIITAMPYVISTIRLPELDANSRIIGNYGSLPASFINTFRALVLQGDSNALHNLPGRALLDPLTVALIALGLVWAVRQWRQLRAGLLLIALVVLLFPVILASGSPNFFAMSSLLPVLALLAGAGMTIISKHLEQKSIWVPVLLAVAILAANAIWTGYDLFTNWATLPGARTAYNADTGEIAHYLDRTSSSIPTVVCDADWKYPRQVGERRSEIERIRQMMNSDSNLLRAMDCREGLLFVNAGAHQQVVIADPEIWNELPPDIADWLAQGTPIETLATNTVIELRVQDALEDALGVYTTTTPASFPTAGGLSEQIPTAPPIRFGGNITWLGYEVDPIPAYRAGEIVSVHTYWRIEGLVPSDLLIFTHILSDPVTIAANRDTLSLDAAHLNERDVYLHIANITLPNNIISGDYVISVGTYQSTSDLRLPVFGASNEVRGDRLFLYPITVLSDN
jgi:hypothetical protein